MKIRPLIKNNKIFTIISIGFLIWLIFLVILSIFGQRTVIFYDALGQVNVSSEFSSEFSFMRYILEPFAAIAFIFEKEFTWMFLFLIFYPILRGISLFLKKRGKFALIFTGERLVDILARLRHFSLEPKRLQINYPSHDSGGKLVLIDTCLGARPGLEILTPLMGQGNFSV